MPSAPAKLCAKPGCRGTVSRGVCTQCGKLPKRGWQSDRNRGTRHERGYDAAWVRLRNEFVGAARLETIKAGKGLNPICAICGEPVRAWEIHVDHIREFDGIADPLRLDWDNLQVVHKRCNMAKAGKMGGGVKR